MNPIKCNRFSLAFILLLFSVAVGWTSEHEEPPTSRRRLLRNIRAFSSLDTRKTARPNLTKQRLKQNRATIAPFIAVASALAEFPSNVAFSRDRPFLYVSASSLGPRS